MMGLETKALLMGVFLAFGIAVPMPEFFAGMFLGLGACYGVMIVTPPTDRRSLWATLFLGFLSALLVAILHPHARGWWVWGKLPLQGQMMIAGAVSRYIAEACISFGKGLSDWAGKLPGSIRLPGGDK